MKHSKSPNAKQTTLARPVEAKGIGLHTAVPVQVRLLPAPPDTGYVFLRTDLDAFEIDCLIDFPHPLIGVQHRSVTLDNGSFARDIASARTFGFIDEVEALRRANLIRGGSLDNAIVLTRHGMLNETGLRFSDEFVRHKILDIIGDLALLGMTILGRVKAERSGHLLHAALMSSLLRNRAAWEIVDLSEPVSEPSAVAGG